MEFEVSINKPPDVDQLIKLFQQARWVDKTDETRVQLMIENSTIIVTALDREKMVGFARCMTDNVFNGQINNVVVDENYRGRGIGKQLIQRILKSNDRVTYILRADPENIEFYRNLGFENSNLAMVYKRKR